MTPKPPDGFDSWMDVVVSPHPKDHSVFRLARAELADLRKRLADAEALNHSFALDQGHICKPGCEFYKAKALLAPPGAEEAPGNTAYGPSDPDFPDMTEEGDK